MAGESPALVVRDGPLGLLTRGLIPRFAAASLSLRAHSTLILVEGRRWPVTALTFRTIGKNLALLRGSAYPSAIDLES